MAILRRAPALACVVLLGSALSGGACGGSNTSSDTSTSGSGGSADGGDKGGGSDTTEQGGDATSSEGGDASKSPPTPSGCPKSALTILFSPMYSAYDGVHSFQVPAVVNGLDPKQIEIAWSASDPSFVKLEPDPTTGGVMITTRKAGKVSIIASAGNLCGASLLTISSATPQDWMDGSARYNDGVVINRLPRPRGGGGGGAGGTRAVGGTGGAGNSAEAACTNCHGDTASGPFKTVQHTPEQTGGFSDADLIKIFQDGVVPDGGYFDATIVPYAQWQSFHKWDVGDTPQSIVIYLRSLTPAAQTGAANFGGRFGNGGAGGRAGGGAGRGPGFGGGGGTAGTTGAGGTGGT